MNIEAKAGPVLPIVVCASSNSTPCSARAVDGRRRRGFAAIGSERVGAQGVHREQDEVQLGRGRRAERGREERSEEQAVSGAGHAVTAPKASRLLLGVDVAGQGHRVEDRHPDLAFRVSAVRCRRLMNILRSASSSSDCWITRSLRRRAARVPESRVSQVKVGSRRLSTWMKSWTSMIHKRRRAM